MSEAVQFHKYSFDFNIYLVLTFVIGALALLNTEMFQTAAALMSWSLLCALIKSHCDNHPNSWIANWLDKI